MANCFTCGATTPRFCQAAAVAATKLPATTELPLPLLRCRCSRRGVLKSDL
jgi:hypothetical protein